MALNELIAQGAQFKAPDLLGQYATMQTLQQGMQQNQMNQLNMTEKSRSLAEQEGLRNYLRSNPNLDTPEGLQGLNQYGGAGQLLLGSRIKQKQEMASAQKSAADAGKTEYETTRMKLTDSLKDAAGLTTPGAAITHIQNAVREGKIPQDKAEQLLATIPQDIEGFGKWRQQMMFNLLSAQNQLEQHFGSIDNGQTITQFSVPKYAPGATPNVIAQQQKQLTPGAAEANDIARGNLEVNRGRLKVAQDELSRKQEGMTDLPPKEVQKREASYPTATAAIKGFEANADSFEKDLVALRDHPGLSSITGIAAGRLPGVTDQGRAAKALYDKIVAKGGFQVLQDIRAASKTGGGLGSISNQEGAQLKAAFAAIDRTQEAADIKKALDEAISSLQGSKARMREAYDSTYEYKAPKAGKPGKVLTQQDKDALDWANKNPTDPRAIAIKQYHGG